MHLEIPDVAKDFSRAVADAVADAGGVELAREAEADPLRRGEVLSLLFELGTDYLDPRQGVEETLIAAEVCRVAGESVLPVPISSMVMGDERGWPVVIDPSGDRALVNHADLGRLFGLTIDGAAYLLSEAEPLGQPLAPFVGEVGVTEPDGPAGPLDAALWITLEAHVAIGAMERALALSAEHLQNRRQFDSPLASFQALRFRMAECTVEFTGVRELGLYTAWRLHDSPRDALLDALALRVCVHDAALRILRECHLFHGAIGFCDEHDLSILSRHVQPHLRLPWGREASAELLLKEVEEVGLQTLYGRIGRRSTEALPA